MMINIIKHLNHKYLTMSIPPKITVPRTPLFLFAPDADGKELYILCTKPLALIWVRQTIPAQLYIVEGPQREEILRQAADFYRRYSATHNQN
jgi:hypothetical protein